MQQQGVAQLLVMEIDMGLHAIETEIRLSLCQHWQRDRQADESAQPRGTLQPDLATHQGGQGLADTQAQAGTTITAGGGALCLFKGIEDPAKRLWAHTDAAVAHTEAQLLLPLPLRQQLHRDLDKAPLGKFDGIADKVEEDLAQTQRITTNPSRHTGIRPEIDAQSLAMYFAHRHGQHAVDQFTDEKRGLFELHFARLQLGEVEHVVDQRMQPLGTAVDNLDHLALILGQLGKSELFRHTDNAIHGRANLVAHGGQKLPFLGGGRLRFGLGSGQCSLNLMATDYLLTQPPVSHRQHQNKERDRHPGGQQGTHQFRSGDTFAVIERQPAVAYLALLLVAHAGKHPVDQG